MYSFYHMDSMYWNQIIKLGGKHPPPLSYLIGGDISNLKKKYQSALHNFEDALYPIVSYIYSAKI